MAKALIAEPEDCEAEYRTIEATLLETARGRWFLAEHGRRRRRLESELLHDAIHRFSAALGRPPSLLEQYRAELASITALLDEAQKALDADKAGVVAALAGALTAAEEIYEEAWALEGKTADAASIEAIARRAAEVHRIAREPRADGEGPQAGLTLIAEAVERLNGLVAVTSGDEPAMPPPSAAIEVQPPAPVGEEPGRPFSSIFAGLPALADALAGGGEPRPDRDGDAPAPEPRPL